MDFENAVSMAASLATIAGGIGGLLIFSRRRIRKALSRDRFYSLVFPALWLVFSVALLLFEGAMSIADLAVPGTLGRATFLGLLVAGGMAGVLGWVIYADD